MADNFTTLDASDASITGGADEIAGVKYPRVKLIHGADGVNDGDVSSANGLPVDATGSGDVPITLDGETVTVDLGANNDVTVTGTVDLGATDNAVLDSIAADTGTIAGNTTSLDSKVTACNTEAVVLAAGSAEIGKLAAGTALIGKVGIDQATANANEVVTKAGSVTTEANSADIKTAVEKIDDAISGSEMQVDVVASLPAGTNAIGKLAANSGVDIGDVDILSIAAGDNNIGNVDLASAIPAGTNTIGKVAPNEYELAGNTTHVVKYYTSAGAATDGIVWSPAAGKRWYITDIFINVSAAATVTLEDDLAAGDNAVWKAELAANSGWSHSFTTPLFSGEDAADLLITTTAGNVYITVTGYEI